MIDGHAACVKRDDHATDVRTDDDHERRMVGLERRIVDLEEWLAAVAGDMVDRTGGHQ